AELGDLAHLLDDALQRTGAEEVAENRLVAEVAAERAPARRHQRRGRVLPVLPPVRDVLGVRTIAAIGERQVRHVLAAVAARAADDLAIPFEEDARYLLEPAVAEVLHDGHDRLLALADRDEVELVDERLRLTRRIRST